MYNWKIISKIHRKITAKSILTKILNDPQEDIKNIGLAIDSVIKNNLSEEEKIWINKIENLRKELLSSSEKISITDYGAGSSNASRTADQMYKGTAATYTLGNVCRRMSSPYKWALLLFKIVRGLRPEICLELGTCIGISAAYQSAGLELNKKGKLITLEGAGSLAAIAKKNLDKLEINRYDIVIGRFQDNLEKILTENSIIDYAFIDGHHDQEATLQYFHQILPNLSQGAIVVFDDIYWSAGMKRAWDKIKVHQQIKASFDLYQFGICIINKKSTNLNHTKQFKLII